MTRRWLLAGGVALALAMSFLFAGAAGSLAAVSSSHAIDQLNKQRVRNDLPGGVRSLARLARGCRKHNMYMRRNGLLTHYEQAHRPAYSTAGNRAGRKSVLAFGVDDWRRPRTNPWETAPIHLAQLLAPSLAASGYSELGGYSCAQTLADPRRPAPARTRIYTYPGSQARMYRAERASELPYTPGELLGFGERALTGPYLLVFADGPDRFELADTRIVSATLVHRRTGRVPLRWIDGTHARLRGLIPPGGFLIPVRPLRKRSTYTATVALATPEGRIEHEWSFFTDDRVRR